ncbi:MAG: caspase family protein [Cyanobacteria bacterium J06614_10]
MGFKPSGGEGVSRRAFFQRAGAAIAALGLTDLAARTGLSAAGIQSQAADYTQAIAQSNGRKLALLIGIDDYPSQAVPSGQLGAGKLEGCVTDVELQKALLIHRFGFLPQDIVCLTNKQATRQGIYEAFVSHLYEQAKAGDVVIFHFSGYGAQVRIADLSVAQASAAAINNTGTADAETGEVAARMPGPGMKGVRRSLVPIDGLLPTESRPVINDISEVELKGLLRLLKTKNVTTILDTGFVDVAVPLSGGLRSRARSEVVTGQLPAPFPLMVKQRPMRESDPFPGVLLRGAALDDVVLERQWNDFNAGVFTYVLTQYLWSAPAPVLVETTLARSQEILARWGGSTQQPLVGGTNQSKNAAIYDSPLIDRTRGEGIVQSLSADKKTATLWLGGLPPRVLEYLSSPSVVVCKGRRLKVRSHDGLTARAKLIEEAGNDGAPLEVGQPIFESVRALPKNVDLVVALDSRLERIERVDATSALSALSFVSSTSDTDLPADCLLGKPVDASSGTLTASLNPAKISARQLAQSADVGREQGAEDPAEGQGVGYGLFSLTRSLIPGTLALQDEAIKPAINRLTAKLQTLIALKMLRLSENRAASQLPVRVTLEQVDPKENKLLITRQTFKVETPIKKDAEGFLPEVPIGSRVRYKIFNDSSSPLYYTLINVDPEERLSAFCPVADVPTAVQSTGEEESTLPTISAASIPPGSAVSVPGADLDWAVDAPGGPVETYIICSTLPLINTFDALSSPTNSGGQRVKPLPNPLEVVRALLSDMSQGDESDTYTLDVTKWVTLNFTYQAV